MSALKLLAIDTSNQHCSVALWHNGTAFERHERAEMQHSETVLPLVREVLNAQGLSLHDLDALVVGIGPGGFTGVRLAVAVAQGLAFATDKKVIALSSLLAMAYAAFAAQSNAGAPLTVTVAMDARMQEIYCATYHITHDGFITIQAPSLLPVADFMAHNLYGLTQPNHVLVGNAVAAFSDLAQWCAAHQVKIADIDHSAPHAADLMPAAQIAFHAGQAILPDDIAPLYVRDKIALTFDERAALKAAQ
jgi:tRNA threonylcarbamoyladenosine biosynthesis protein TsaB